LRAEGVRKIYRTDSVVVEALRGLDLRVAAGELVAVMGPSGSGQTTLLNCLSGLDDLDRGRVWLGGVDLFAMADAERTGHRARTMGFVFQASNLIPVCSTCPPESWPSSTAGRTPRPCPSAPASRRPKVPRAGRSPSCAPDARIRAARPPVRARRSRRGGGDRYLCRPPAAWFARIMVEHTMDAPEPLLRAEGVRKIYRSDSVVVEALRGLDLKVAAGELVAVMGPSGSGKTTLLNCLSGLDDLDGGRVWLGGVDLFAMADAERTEHRARTMGFVFQAFNLIPVFTAAENVELPLLLAGQRRRDHGFSRRRRPVESAQGTPPRQARQRALDMLDRVGLAARAGHRPNELSGGEQQRVTIARALVARPAIVWADEPTGNLDSEMAAQVMDLLNTLNRDEGQTIILVTHDPGIGAAAGRLIRMRDGRLVSDEGRDRDRGSHDGSHDGKPRLGAPVPANPAVPASAGG
jgi:putative ABC transport system ATP-binding protein